MTETKVKSLERQRKEQKRTQSQRNADGGREKQRETQKETETQRYKDKWRQRGREKSLRTRGAAGKRNRTTPETNKQNTNALLPRLSSGARK